MKKAMVLPLVGLIVLVACQSQTTSSSSKDTSTYFEVTSNPVKIVTDDQYEVTLDATDTWGFSVQEGQDVTEWLVLKSDKKAVENTSGVATVTTVDSDSSKITITIDAGKITGFSSNGGENLYLLGIYSSLPNADG